ncbi:MAG: sulfite exporter TauE/SafE family protein [Hyphomonadaceae bacterium]
MIDLTDILSAVSGVVVGFVLGLLGGGGSILAVPLLLYVVGLRDTHIAIGTSAVAVAANALIGLAGHARAGNVKWPCATVYAASGVVGAWIGSTIGKSIDGKALLGAFAIAMLAVGANTLWRKRQEGNPDVHLSMAIAGRLAGFGLLTGLAAGFFGIGGGFLIVPGLLAGAGMAMLNAIGSSLLSVAALGSTTATNYAVSGLVDWRIAAFFIVGGVLGSFLGIVLGKRLASRKGLLSAIFGWVVIVVGLYVLEQAIFGG